MPSRLVRHAFRLEFAEAGPIHTNLSGAVFTGEWLWVAGDEACELVRLERLPETVGGERWRYGHARSFRLADLLDLPAGPDDEADLEGMAIADGQLWVVGSHGSKRKKPKPDRDAATNAKRLARIALDGNRRLLACLPLGTDPVDGSPVPLREAPDGRRALRLQGDATTNALTELLADDPHFAPFLKIPGKDNGFDIEGLAVVDGRLLLGLRGPVLRGWTAMLELAVEARGDHLALAPFDADGNRLRKHFLQLEGKGIRDLHLHDGDLYLLAGPTMVLDGEIRVYRWPGARAELAAQREPVRFEADLQESIALPHGRGVNRAEAMCDLPASMAGSEPGWLVLYDAPGPDRRVGDRIVLGDLLRR